MYLLPGLLIFGLFVALPLGGTIALSFTEWDGYGSPLNKANTVHGIRMRVG